MSKALASPTAKVSPAVKRLIEQLSVGVQPWVSTQFPQPSPCFVGKEQRYILAGGFQIMPERLPMFVVPDLTDVKVIVQSSPCLVTSFCPLLTLPLI